MKHPKYLIYDDGRVWSKYVNKFIKPRNCPPDPYLKVNLYQKNKSIHRLVALHYVPNPDKERYTVVDHIDRNCLNNHYTNLRWVNNSMNQQNTGVQCNNKLGIKNISYIHREKRYSFQKVIGGKKTERYFKTLEEAVQCKEEFMRNIQDTADIPPDVERTSAPLDP